MTKPLALVIEDDPQLNKIYSISLRNDFEVESCVDGGEALTRLAEIVPDVVVLDINLPGASGVEILAHIRADTRLAKTKVIISSANERIAEELDDKADLVLLKPVSPRQLSELAARFKP
jgi:CheY-like chemotaxis protein